MQSTNIQIPYPPCLLDAMASSTFGKHKCGAINKHRAADITLCEAFFEITCKLVKFTRRKSNSFVNRASSQRIFGCRAMELKCRNMYQNVSTQAWSQSSTTRHWSCCMHRSHPGLLKVNVSNVHRHERISAIVIYAFFETWRIVVKLLTHTR